MQTLNITTSRETLGNCYTGGGISTTEYGELEVNSSKDLRYKENIGCIKPLILKRLLPEMRSEFQLYVKVFAT